MPSLIQSRHCEARSAVAISCFSVNCLTRQSHTVRMDYPFIDNLRVQGRLPRRHSVPPRNDAVEWRQQTNDSVLASTGLPRHTVATSPLSSHSRSARQSSVAATSFYSLHLPQAALVNVPRNDSIKVKKVKAVKVASFVSSSKRRHCEARSAVAISYFGVSCQAGSLQKYFFRKLLCYFLLEESRKTSP